ncbi:MAG: Chaperone protein DnaK [Myxococcaceae bacterium]|nr:Chaperone protein DnaK [Myxococcaceae bacterium]
MSPRVRYVVGIDLGTTHTVVGFVDLTRRSGTTRAPIEVFDVEQLVAPGQVAKRPLLPSFRYHSAEGELPLDDLSLGRLEYLPELPDGVVGTFAQQLGSKVPGRLVSSAKSWLSHAAVDRSAAILPWGAAEGVPTISPVSASASYLGHVRARWNAAHPEHPLETQEVVLTVPASFDEAARAFTLEAARRAGLDKLRLLEEPQAAFYDWLNRHQDTLETELHDVKLALVVDVGGGTTDLTLIHVELRESGARLTRIAVGDHLMLGGDNMDLALARASEPALTGSGERLPIARFAQLVEQSRGAKERLLSESPPEQENVSVLGSGSKLIGGTRTATLTRARVEELVVDGFMPRVPLTAKPEQKRIGLVEFGLPYASEPAITKHVAAFLLRHQQAAAEALKLTPDPLAPVLPDVVLYNGGVFRSAALKARLSEVLASFRGSALRELENLEPELSVARGAVAYGLARRGVGVRIGGGSPRSYYLLIEAENAEKKGLCVLPRGAEEGEELVLKSREFLLRVGKPVRFRLWTSTLERAHRIGELVELDDSYQELPAIAAVLDAQAGDPLELRVELHTGLTEVGTLEMSCVAAADASRRYKLEFELRGHRGGGNSQVPQRVTQLHPRFEEATALVHSYYGKSNKELEGKRIKTLRGDLEKVLGPREGWDTALLRELFGALLSGAKRRRRSADHERLWLHLTGYCLRPGFGYPLDPFRVDQVWSLRPEGLQFTPDPQVWSQWWILWRRIAGGLDEARQLSLLDELSFYLEPQGPRPRSRPKGPKALALEDMVRLSGALERVPAARKSALGAWLLARLDKGEISAQSGWWAIGRLGARAPLYGSAHAVVPSAVAGSWLKRALESDLSTVEQVPFAVAQLARLTHDRQRDLEPALRERAAVALARVRDSELWIKLIREGGELSAAEESRVFGESLPPGIRLGSEPASDELEPGNR